MLLPQLILASSSIYRRQLLERLCTPLGIAFQSISPDVDETALASELPVDTAKRLAKLKVQVIAQHHPKSLIIGSDQVADLDGEALSKPGDHQNALKQLQSMRGRTITFYTALAIIDTTQQKIVEEVVSTDVSFRNLPDSILESYLQIEKPYHCAGSAQHESLGIMLTSKVSSDDPTALIGLPLISVVRLIEQLGHRFLK